MATIIVAGETELDQQPAARHADVSASADQATEQCWLGLGCALLPYADDR
jgi:hypothetical protein